MIVIDRPVWRWRGRRWSHLASDHDYDELHAFAGRLGLRREWFQGDHYDLPEERWDEAVALGATPIDSRELVRRLAAAGLRRPRRNRTAHR
ncbi:MAG TPA: DUF4031 domain-containing protein [Euzebyales bacterium]|nr:DUF4031 domain-containing protein [Euzebyales bacterium]